MDEVLDKVIDNSAIDNSNNFSKIGIGVLLGLIIIGIFMSVSGLPGLPLTIPGVGFLIGHLFFRTLTRKLSTKSKVRAKISILFLILLVLFQIEVLNFLSYNAVIVCAMAFSFWILIELIRMKVINNKAKTF